VDSGSRGNANKRSAAPGRGNATKREFETGSSCSSVGSRVSPGFEDTNKNNDNDEDE
jgi:hypothetical protein